MNHKPQGAVLMKVMIEDEERHHRVLEKLVTTLQDMMWGTHSNDAFPMNPALSGQKATKHIKATRDFMRRERDDARTFRSLARKVGKHYDGPFKLLLETIAMDSQKRERMLRFIHQRLTSN
ncbi:MAG: hypothetical protein V3U79_11570 [Dehalococcoidia bacterium]